MRRKPYQQDPRAAALQAEIQAKVAELLQDGLIKELADIPDSFILSGLVTLVADSRRPAVQLNALRLIAEMKGMGTGSSKESVHDTLSRALGQVPSPARKGPRPIAKAE